MNFKKNSPRSHLKDAGQWAGLAGLIAAGIIVPRALKRASPYLRRGAVMTGDGVKKAWAQIRGQKIPTRGRADRKDQKDGDL